MPEFYHQLKTTILKISYKNLCLSKSRVFSLMMVSCITPYIYAGWYAGGSMLLHPLPYLPIKSNYIKLGSSKKNVLANGISINLGYKFSIRKYILATEFDVGGFSDGDGDLIYQDIKHYVSASYYMAFKQKVGIHIKSNIMIYGLLGLSENSIGDRVYIMSEYFNTKQLSFLYGGGLEYYTKSDSKLALYAEWFYFTPTGGTLYSGGANSPSNYSLSTYGQILQLGIRYYFS